MGHNGFGKPWIQCQCDWNCTCRECLLDAAMYQRPGEGLVGPYKAPRSVKELAAMVLTHLEEL